MSSYRPQCVSWRSLLASLLFISLYPLDVVQGQASRGYEEPVFGAGSDSGEYLRTPRSQWRDSLSGETQEIRIAQQYGLGYLPLMIMRQYELLQKHARANGLGNVRVAWSRFPSGKAMNNALQVGLLDFGSGGVGPLLEGWDQTGGSRGLMGVAALASMPMFLNTTDSRIKSLADFTDRDRIALPAVQRSVQAVTLQMAAAKSFGLENFDRFDKLTVSMSHPDAVRELLSGTSGITAHFASPPYQYEELDSGRVRTVLSSYDVLGGPTTFTVLWTRAEFFTENPQTTKAFYAALKEAMEIIEGDRRNAAEVYVQQSDSDLPVEFVERMISHPMTEYTTVPLHIMGYAKFMHSIGTITNLPRGWWDVFLPTVHNEPGS